MFPFNRKKDINEPVLAIVETMKEPGRWIRLGGAMIDTKTSLEIETGADTESLRSLLSGHDVEKSYCYWMTLDEERHVWKAFCEAMEEKAQAIDERERKHWLDVYCK